jgi:hypothetical protein
LGDVVGTNNEIACGMVWLFSSKSTSTDLNFSQDVASQNGGVITVDEVDLTDKQEESGEDSNKHQDD